MVFCVDEGRHGQDDTVGGRDGTPSASELPHPNAEASSLSLLILRLFHQYHSSSTTTMPPVPLASWFRVPPRSHFSLANIPFGMYETTPEPLLAAGFMHFG